MRISEAKRQARVAEWAQNIRDQQDSGLTVKAWCGAQGCGEGRFYYWLKIIRAAAIERAEQAGESTSLARVEPERLPSSTLSMAIGTVNQSAIRADSNQQRGMVIRYGNVTVELAREISVGAVAELLKALNAP